MSEPKIFWECGCVTWREGDVFYIKACGRPGCEVLRAVVEITRSQGKKIITQGIGVAA
jgi:hypothetical protein